MTGTGIWWDVGFWVAAGAMTLAVGALMVLALIRGRDARTPAAAYDLQVYRDQLREVERDLARGTITAAEAQRVRTEVSRRVLEADRALSAGAGQGARPNAAPRAAGWVAGGVIALSLAGAVALYLDVGAPGEPDAPMAQRLAEARKLAVDRPSQAQIEAVVAREVTPPAPDPKYADLVAKLRAAVARNPDDLEGQQLLARNEAALDRFVPAYHAQETVIRLKGDKATAADHARLAELMINATGGYVSPAAERQLNIALKLDPDEDSARFFLGLMMAQIGRPDIGFRTWAALLDDLPAGSRWQAPLRAQLPRMAELAGARYTLPPAPTDGQPGPSAADIAASKAMSPAERQEMIRGMVEGLAQRLDSDGGSPEDWARLIRAYGVLGETDKQAAARARALATYKGNAAAEAVIAAAQDETSQDGAAAQGASGATGATGATGAPPAAAALPGPTAAQVDAAQNLSPKERRSMVAGMVARLSDRLATQGGPAPDWARLIGAYGVLGETGRARAIWQEAQTRFKDHPADLAQIRDAAVKAGVAQ